MNILFLMDPPETINPTKDTTYALIKECLNRNYKVYYVTKQGISIHKSDLIFKCHQLKLESKNLKPMNETTFKTNDIDCFWIRTDPPFNQSYLEHTWFLENMPSSIPIFNSPTGIRTVNEKIWATRFPDIVPETLITSNKQTFISFLEKEKTIIAKPLDGYGGSNIFKVEITNTNKYVIFETLTENSSKPILLQAYVKEAEIGDKRILLLNGDPLGALLRVHPPDDHRNNLFTGGNAQKAAITKNDEKVISILKPHLIKLGLYFVGIDIIGDYLIEVNVTSPTGLQEINTLNNTNLETQIIDFMKSKTTSH